MPQFPPQAFLVGAQKCGTTTLATLLGRHPDIVVSTPKETDFFTWNCERGLEWYRSCFSGSGRLLLDASPSYSMAAIDGNGVADDTTPGRIRAASPDARFIYIVRDPAERCYSAYLQEVRNGRELVPLRKAVEQFRHYYLDPSLYHAQISNFLKHFPLDRFLFLHLDELSADPAAVVERCWRFLGLDPPEDVAFEVRKTNESFVYNPLGRLLREAAGEERLKAIGGLVERIVPGRFHAGLKRMVQSVPPALSAADRAWLMARLGEDASAFITLTGVKILPPQV
jgi:hypothetical protein